MLPKILLFLFYTLSISAMTDCDWVRIIYQKMGGDVRRIPKDCCKKNGVICAEGHVTGLYWSKQSLVGSIPRELVELVNLEDL
jgi:hypothetical protein